MSTENLTSTPISIEEHLKLAEAHCQELGVRFTSVRRHVLTLLLEQQRAVKAYQLLDAMKSFQENATPPTVYRALEFLLEAGLAHRLDSLNAYVACTLHTHDHSLLLVCPSCNAVAEINDPSLCHQLAARAQEVGYQLEGECLEIKAICKNCKPQTTPCCAGH